MSSLSASVAVARPRVEWVPPAVSSEGPVVADFAAKHGLVLDGWQRYVLECGLGVDEFDGWVSRTVGCCVPRQNGKGAIIEALELAALFLFGDSVVHTAHEVKTARKAFHRLRRLVEASPGLMSQVKSIRSANGQESIELKSGALVEFIARSRGSGRGFTAPLLILDEAMILEHEAMEALTYVQSTFDAEAQTWLFGSAGFADSEVWRDVREAGVQGGAPRATWLEWGAPVGADLDDLEAWRAANPAFGVRLTERTVQAERTMPGMTDHGFARERLGIWDEPAGAMVIRAEVWDALLAETERLDVVAVAFDVSPDQDHGSVAVAGRRKDGKWQVGVWDSQPGDGWIVAELLDIIDRRRVCRVVADPRSPAWALTTTLAQKGVEVSKVSMQDMAAACSGLLSAVVMQELVHGPQPVLDAAIAAARKRNVGEAGWAWARRNTTDDITPLVAVTLARFAYEQAMAEGWTDVPDTSVYESRGLVEL